MNDRQLRNRLRRIPAPGGDPARDRAIARATLELRAATPPVPSGRRSRPRLGRAAALVLAIVVVLLAATGPGRSLAEDLARLIGIGDEPTREVPFSPPAPPKDSQVVIGVGQTASGARYEVVASRGVGQGAGSGGPLCFRVSFPELPEQGSLQCLTDAALATFEPDSLIANAFEGPTELEAGEQTVVVAIAGGEVSAATSKATSSEGLPVERDARVFELTPELASQLGVDVQAGYLLALLPEVATGDGPVRVDLLAAGADGEPVSRTTVEVRGAAP